MKNRIAILAASVASLLVSSAAQADEPKAVRIDEPRAVPVDETTTAPVEETRASEARRFTPAFATSRAGGFVDVWPAKDNLATIHGAELQLRLSETTFLDLSMTGAYARARAAGANIDSMGYGNPTIGMHFVGSPSDNLTLYGGFSITPPLLQDPSEEVSDVAFYGARIRGFYDADRFVRGHLAARLAGGLEWNIGNSPVLIRAELRPVAFVPTNDKFEGFGSSGEMITPSKGGMKAGRANVGFVVESAVEAEVRSDSGFGGGLRFQAVALPTEEDMAQMVFEPFLALTPRTSGLYMRLGAPLALDADLGLGLDPNRLAAVRFAIGGQW